VTKIAYKSENELVNKLRKDDENAWIFLFEEYYAGLCAYSRPCVGRKDIA